MCVSQGFANILDPAGALAQKANTAILPSSIAPTVSAFSGLGGTTKAYQDYMKAPDAPAQPKDQPGSGSTTVTPPSPTSPLSIPLQPTQSGNGLNIPT